MSDYYETRMEILKKIHDLRDLVIKTPGAPKTKGDLKMIYRCIRDGVLSKDENYKNLCFALILDHINQLDDKCGLSEDDERLKRGLRNMEEILNTTGPAGLRQNQPTE
jgi:hypothetical protein